MRKPFTQEGRIYTGIGITKQITGHWVTWKFRLNAHFVVFSVPDRNPFRFVGSEKELKRLLFIAVSAAIALSR